MAVTNEALELAIGNMVRRQIIRK